MLLIGSPKNTDDYYKIKDDGLNMFLQLKHHHPRYLYNGNYYYKKTNKLKNDIILYSVQCESEVSRFVESL